MALDKAALAVAAVLTLADEVWAYLEHGDLKGLRVTMLGSAQDAGAERIARVVLVNVESGLSSEAAPARKVGLRRWHDLAE